MHTALSQLTAGGFGIGIEAPLDNDWTSAGEYARQQAGRLPGEPDLERHADLARQQPGLAVLPNLSSALPLIVAGLAQQSPAGTKPYATFIHLDSDEHPSQAMRRWRFGFQGGRDALIAEIHALRAIGVDHVSLHFRRNRRPLDETLQEIAEYVLPHFHIVSDGAVAPSRETHHE